MYVDATMVTMVPPPPPQFGPDAHDVAHKIRQVRGAHRPGLGGRGVAGEDLGQHHAHRHPAQSHRQNLAGIHFKVQGPSYCRNSVKFFE